VRRHLARVSQGALLSISRVAGCGAVSAAAAFGLIAGPLAGGARAAGPPGCSTQAFGNWSTNCYVGSGYSTNSAMVAGAQNLLQGDLLYSGTIDGIFGSGTDSAVLSFQGGHSLTQDGIVGSNTWKAMVADVKRLQCDPMGVGCTFTAGFDSSHARFFQWGDLNGLTEGYWRTVNSAGVYVDMSI
jgi:zinc D-Ala-D-Ala carboxypeptidase